VDCINASFYDLDMSENYILGDLSSHEL